MAVNILIGGAIFGYAFWTIRRFVRKSKEGKCSGCGMSERCSQSGCQTIE